MHKEGIYREREDKSLQWLPIAANPHYACVVRRLRLDMVGEECVLVSCLVKIYKIIESKDFMSILPSM